MSPSPTPTNSHLKILAPNVIVLEGKAFGRLLDHQGGALIKKTP